MIISLSQLDCKMLLGASRFVMRFRTSGSPSCWTDWNERSTNNAQEFVQMVDEFVLEEENYRLQQNTPGFGKYELELEVIF